MPKIERRKNIRIPYQLFVSTNLTTTGYLETHDISSFGMYVKTSNPLEEGSKVFVSFSLPGMPIPIKSYGRVAWINHAESDDKPRGFGIEFLSLSEFDTKRLEKFLDAIYREQVEYEVKIDSDITTLFDFSLISKDSLELRSKKTFLWESDMSKKGYYTYRRQLLSPCANRVLISEDGKEREMIMMGSNSYLGLSSHPKVIEAVNEATKKYGVGAASAPMLAGTFELHRKLEKKVAELKGCEDAIIFPSGYATNVGTISCFLRKNDLAIIDRLAHASIIDGCTMSDTNFKTFKHSDPQHLEEMLMNNRKDFNEVFVIVEGVYSMDGDIVPLPEIVSIAKKYNARVMIDDAHATGVIGEKGKGTTSHYNMDGEVDVVMGTFSKAIGQFGGFIATNKEFVSYLRHYARSYFFATSLPPVIIAASLAAFEVIETEPELLENLWRNINYFKKNMLELGFQLVPNTESAIIPIIIGEEKILKPMGARMHEEGIYINPIPYPAVPRNKSRFRATIMATHTIEDLDYTIQTFRKVGEEFGIIDTKKKVSSNYLN